MFDSVNYINVETIGLAYENGPSLEFLIPINQIQWQYIISINVK
jgi:hypothetical protein